MHPLASYCLINKNKKMNNIKIVKIIFTAAFLYAAHVNAQSAITGQVKASGSGQEVPFAVIGIKNTQLSVISDVNGNFKFNGLPNGSYVMLTKSLGYQDRSDTLSVAADLVFDPVLTPSNKQLEEIVVNATRVDNSSGMAYSNVDAETIKKQNLGQDAPYMLNQLTSVVVNSDAGNGVGYTGLRIRGSDPTRINVTINGVPVNDAESQGSFFVDMPDLVSSVNNIQVQRGVGSSNNGAGAFGASINFQTNELKEKAYANVISTAGSYKTNRNTLAAGTGLLNGKFTLDARASKISSNGYIDRASSDLSSYYLAAGYYGKKTVIKFINFAGFEKTYQAWYYVNEDSIKAGNRTYNEVGQYTDANGRLKYYNNETDNYKQDNFQLHFVHQFSARTSLNLTGHYTKGKGYYEQYKQGQSFADYNLNDPGLFFNDSTPVTATNLIRRRWLDNDFAGGIFNLNHTVNSELNFTLGGGYNTYFGRHYGRVIWAQYSSDGEIDHEYYHNTANKNDGNVYLKTNYKPIKNLNVFLDVQVRYLEYRFPGFDSSYVAQTQTQVYTFFNPKLGLSYTLNKYLNVYASLAKANKEPNRDDFVENKPKNRPKPEQLIDAEAGLKYGRKKFTAAINFYNMHYKDQLILNGQVSDVGSPKRVNVDKSYRRGIELEAGISVNRFVSLAGNLTLSQNKIQDFVEYIDSANADYSVYTQHKNVYKNTDIALSPGIISSLALTLKPVKNLEITLANKYVGRQFLDNTSNKKRSISPYNVLDLRLNYSIKTRLISEIGLMLGVYNLLNEVYETNGYTFSYYYDSAQLTTSNYKAPAAPLNFLAGVNIRF
jgi:iron complex outermembrane recepter protein